MFQTGHIVLNQVQGYSEPGPAFTMFGANPD